MKQTTQQKAKEQAYKLLELIPTDLVEKFYFKVIEFDTIKPNKKRYSISFSSFSSYQHYTYPIVNNKTFLDIETNEESKKRIIKIEIRDTNFKTLVSIFENGIISVHQL